MLARSVVAMLATAANARPSQGGGSPLQSDDTRTFAENCAQRWTALGNNTWMTYTDGKVHYEGSSTFDFSGDSTHLQDGNASGHLHDVFTHFHSPDAWFGLRWTARKLADFNAQLRGVNTCRHLHHCPELFFAHYLARVPFTELTHHERHETPHHASCLPPTSPTFDSLNKTMATVGMNDSKAADLDKLFDSYYADLDSGNVGLLDPSLGRMPAGMPEAFPRLSLLYSSLMDLHPFREANSRSRLLVLQTELVRLGGHMLMLEELGWGQYYFNTKASLQANLLTGWCAYEYVAASGTSPYPEGYNIDFHDSASCCRLSAQDNGTSTRHAVYIDGCMPSEHSAAYWNPHESSCVHVPMSDAAKGRLAFGATSEAQYIHVGGSPL